VNTGPLIFLGTFFALATSWLGFVLAPQLQLGDSQQAEVLATGQMYPAHLPGMAAQGEHVYRANGCFYCHSQQVRPKGFGADFERHWGGRASIVQSVNQDYLYDHTVMLGNQRVGPDLMNIGLRQPNQTNVTMLLLHIYNPQLTMPKSVMPPYHFLFEKRKLAFGEKPSEDALPLPESELKPGYEVVPTDDAQALAAYLLSRRADAILYETPPFKVATNAVTHLSSTNAPSTNAPAATAPPETNSPAK
jgi:cytochrome c oxidase cbb3-type subunit 2